LQSKGILLSAGVVLIITVGILAALAYRARLAPGIVYDATQVQIFKITSEGNLVGGAASISPDGKYLVYVVKDGENVSLWTRQIVTGISRQISPLMRGAVLSVGPKPDEQFNH